MNRKKKFILIGVLAIVYMIIALNFHKIKFALSMFRLYSAEKNHESVIDSTENNNNTAPIVDNPLKNILESKDTVSKDDNPVDNKDTDMNNSKDKPAGQNTKPVDSSDNSYINILNDYNNQFENLRSEFEEDLNALIKQALLEYTKGDMSTTQLASKYLSLGSKLEKSSDSKFNAMVKDMEKELKKNNHDTDISKEVKAYYHNFKDIKKTDLLSRGMKHVD